MNRLEQIDNENLHILQKIAVPRSHINNKEFRDDFYEMKAIQKRISRANQKDLNKVLTDRDKYLKRNISTEINLSGLNISPRNSNKQIRSQLEKDEDEKLEKGD